MLSLDDEVDVAQSADPRTPQSADPVLSNWIRDKGFSMGIHVASVLIFRDQLAKLFGG
jgi:hypothetical protein